MGSELERRSGECRPIGEMKRRTTQATCGCLEVAPLKGAEREGIGQEPERVPM
jgi:hypothetical protein